MQVSSCLRTNAINNCPFSPTTVNLKSHQLDLAFGTDPSGPLQWPGFDVGLTWSQRLDHMTPGDPSQTKLFCKCKMQMERNLPQQLMQGKRTSLSSNCLKNKGHWIGQQRTYSFLNPNYLPENYHTARIFYPLGFAMQEVARLLCASWPTLLKVNRKWAHLRLPFRLSRMTGTPV